MAKISGSKWIITCLEYNFCISKTIGLVEHIGFLLFLSLIKFTNPNWSWALVSSWTQACSSMGIVGESSFTSQLYHHHHHHMPTDFNWLGAIFFTLQFNVQSCFFFKVSHPRFWPGSTLLKLTSIASVEIGVRKGTWWRQNVPPFPFFLMNSSHESLYSGSLKKLCGKINPRWTREICTTFYNNCFNLCLQIATK